ncbi:TetR family transcriptional regulator [Nonomuraea sp. WAC 01424]|uniref:TetR/AcrR family transcriptional regulator n=1 Tax=Nonomuraea sp. WAC 01424 TaxID=2203200 RepID=UPI000F78F301|nr:TetR/AcrR family transcriptional regulator [Nonomuraea sp. WAC 01424]RSN06828.1 TetR family transcriptional regulator [Nonomuraea sp. WAC 01424]
MENPGLRRRPVQRRSIDRVERILDASARLLDEVGLDALTISDVARSAGVPAGTIYQFFDGRPGMLRELALRNLELLLARLRVRIAAEPALTWPRAAEVVLAETVAMRRSVPGFTVVDFADTRPGGASFLPAGSVRESGDVLAERLYHFALEEAGLPALPDPYRVMRLAIQATAAVLHLSFSSTPQGDRAMVEQGRRLLRAYFVDVSSETFR